MATRPYDTTIATGGGGANRWRLPAIVALASFLLWTTVLGAMLLLRWPDSASSVTSRDGLTAADSTVGFAPRSAGTTAAARPKAYSSIDTQTLAAARVREEVLAGKRVPPEEGEPQAVAAPSAAQPAPTAQPPRIDPANSRAELPPRPLLRLTDAHEAQRRPLSSGQRPSPGVNRPPIERMAPVQEANGRSDRDVPTLGLTGALRSERQSERPLAPTPAASRTASPDAGASQLDDRWERREQWLRERLSR